MAKLIRRILGLLGKLGFYEKSFTIIYEGQGVSLNQFYDGRHWRNRHKIKKEYRPMLYELISNHLDDDEEINEFALLLFYNSRHDPDNITGLEKLFVDALRKDDDGNGWVIDDSKKFFKFYGVIPDTSLKSNTFEFELIKIK